MKGQMIRQGDVLLCPCRRPKTTGTPCDEQGRIVLAHGEATGHAHEVVALGTDIEMLPPAQFFQEPDGSRVLIVDRPCALVHQEHGPITLAPGAYRVVRQREYSPEEIRNVAD